MLSAMSKDTQFGGPRGPKSGRPPGVLVGKAELARQKRKAQIDALVQARKPIFEGDPLAFWDQLFRDETQPIGIRMTAADKLAKLSEQSAEQPSKQFEALIAAAHASVPPPPKELPPQVDAFTATMLRLANEEFELVLAKMDRIAHAARIDGDMPRVRKIERERREAVDSWNRAAEQERAKLAE
jgi:hypothetical protein